MQPRRHIPVENYFERDERDPDIRWEYAQGQMMPVHGFEGPESMAGASPRHVQIAGNLHTAFNTQLRDHGCHVAQSDLRVAIDDTTYTYPDLVVTCEPPTFDRSTLLNPGLVIEVASASTAERDRGDKLRWYTQHAHILEYWIVEQKEPACVQYIRRDTYWEMRPVIGIDTTIVSAHFDLRVPMRDVYTLAMDLPM